MVHLGFNSFGGGSLMGINVESVNVNQAFKGTSQVTTITTYLEESIQTIRNVTVELQNLSTDLDRIKQNYVSENASITVKNLSGEGLNLDVGVVGFGD